MPINILIMSPDSCVIWRYTSCDIGKKKHVSYCAFSFLLCHKSRSLRQYFLPFARHLCFSMARMQAGSLNVCKTNKHGRAWTWHRSMTPAKMCIVIWIWDYMCRDMGRSHALILSMNQCVSGCALRPVRWVWGSWWQLLCCEVPEG